MRRLHARWERAHGAQGEGGFTLVEVLLAMFLIVAMMVVTIGVLLSSLVTIAVARQRQSGAALATQSIESMRALPYSTVTAGSAAGCDTTLGLAATTDNVSGAGASAVFSPSSTVLAIAPETLVVNTQSPCAYTTTVDSTTYTVRQYVTRSATSDAFALTAIATWKKKNGQAGTSVERTETFSPGGCLQDSLHPFSGPCQAAFSARGGTDAMSVSVTPVDAAGVPQAAEPSITLVLPAASSTLEVEQSVALTSTGVAAGGVDSTGTASSSPQVLTAGSDPTSTVQQTFSGVVSVPGRSTTSVLGATTLTAATGTTTGSLGGAVSAGSGACLMPTATGAAAAVSTGPAGALRPCAVAGLVHGGPATLALGGAQLFTSEGVRTSAGAAQVYKGTSAGVCGATAPGCARASAARSIGTARFLPGVAPVGLWQLTGLTESAVAERGATTPTPTQARSGTLRLWTGVAYTDVPLTGLDATYVWDSTGTGFPPVTAGSVTVTGTLVVTTGGSTLDGASDCADEACVVQVDSGSISGRFTVTDTAAGQAWAVDVQLGGATAVAAYQEAPVA
ncbi:hypothetical protein [Cellulomonas soli]|uniref:Prepilin-type N-terminal cleavage/methylation domain-containing protein n=1 Tax=Cellulomonas soli TaxID=931535 RepID=A0A512PA74_9CELL|nr:hypothetical protein [Cellulomonas soli]NYI60600.1 type II secretory pathway pseudopilin PulG [Cellulomonas soli]GEP68115.1 hypothetical protein CSO01_08300 [Cellulomonas soli]